MWGGYAGEQRHGTALGEAAEDDSGGGNPGGDFGGEKVVEQAARAEDAGLVVRVFEVFECRLGAGEQISWHDANSSR